MIKTESHSHQRLSTEEIVDLLVASDVSFAFKGVLPKNAALRISDITEKVIVGPTKGKLNVKYAGNLRDVYTRGPEQEHYIVKIATIDNHFFEFHHTPSSMVGLFNGNAYENVPFLDYLAAENGNAPLKQAVKRYFHFLASGKNKVPNKDYGTLNPNNRPAWTSSLNNTRTPGDGFSKSTNEGS